MTTEEMKGDKQTATEPIPTCYQGEIKSPKELSIGDVVIDTTGGMRKVCRVVKRYQYSVKLELANGIQYGQSLHALRRVV
jgi:hypothetical protein